jgi:hypothetical protein
MTLTTVVACLLVAAVVGAVLWLTGRRYRLDPAAKAGRRTVLLAAAGALGILAVREVVNALGGNSGGSAQPAGQPRGPGYWLVTANGTVVPQGAAPFYGSAADRRPPPAAPVVALVRTPTARGYWLVTQTGDLLPFGDAGPLRGPAASRPVVAAALVRGPVAPIGKVTGAPGLWLLTDDGDVLVRGQAPAFGSLALTALDHPVVGIESTATGLGYWVADAHGTAFAFGDAPYYKSVTDQLNRPVTGISAVADRLGYWLVAADGGVFAYPTNTGAPAAQKFYGSLGSYAPATSVVGIAPTFAGDGYWIVDDTGVVHPFGAAPPVASPLPAGLGPVTGIVTAG